MALITASDYYRDFYFFLYMNGKKVQAMDDLPVEPPRTLDFFINLSKPGEQAEIPCMSSVTQSKTTANPSTATVNPSKAAATPSTALVNPSTAAANPSTALLNPSTAAANPSSALVHPSTTNIKVSKAAVKTYKVQHPSEDKDLSKWMDEHRILTKSSLKLNSNGKGADFMQG